MTDSKITTTILRQIRDEIIATRTELKAEIAELKVEIAGTNARLDTTNERIDTTNERLDETNERLGVVQTVVLDLVAQVKTTAGIVKAAQSSAIEDLRERVSRLEAKVG